MHHIPNYTHNLLHSMYFVPTSPQTLAETLTTTLLPLVIVPPYNLPIISFELGAVERVAYNNQYRTFTRGELGKFIEGEALLIFPKNSLFVFVLTGKFRVHGDNLNTLFIACDAVGKHLKNFRELGVPQKVKNPEVQWDTHS